MVSILRGRALGGKGREQGKGRERAGAGWLVGAKIRGSAIPEKIIANLKLSAGISLAGFDLP